MVHKEGQLVRHPNLGIGKILIVAGDKVTVFFKDQSENPRLLSTAHVVLEVLPDDADPWLKHLDMSLAKSKRQYLTHQAAIDKFLRVFPQAFSDPKYLDQERDYKVAAHKLWDELLNRQEFDRLLASNSVDEVVQRALKVESRTNLLAVQEKAALREAVRGADAMLRFATGLHDLIYGKDDYEQRFERFAATLSSLPQPQTELRWTVQTIFPFLALPTEHIFLKPSVTKQAAERRAFSLNYKPQPNWLTYSCLLNLAQLLMQDLAELKPRDMIDIQSFIWAAGDDKYLAH